MTQIKSFHAGVDVIWLALLSVYIMGGAAIVPFHGDESSKIYIGRDYYYLFLEGEREKLSQQAKRSAGPGQYRANLASGSISNMIYGWLAASSGYAITDLNDDWHWGLDYRENLESNRVPEARLLWMARLAAAAQLAAAAALVYAFARISINRPTALLASLFFAAHPTLLLNGRRAMQEGSHLLGIMLVLVMAAWLIRERRWRGYALLGACAGCAIAAKHSSAFTVAIVFLAIFGLSVYERLPGLRGTKLASAFATPSPGPLPRSNGEGEPRSREDDTHSRNRYDAAPAKAIIAPKLRSSLHCNGGNGGNEGGKTKGEREPELIGHEPMRRAPRPRLDMRPFTGILLAGIIALLVFYLLNPGWWEAPLATAGEVMSERTELLQRQAGVYGGYQSLSQQARGFFRFVLIGEPQYFEDKAWAGYTEISEQIQFYEGSGWAGATIGGNALAGLVMSALVAAGMILLIRDRDISLQNRALLLFWGGGIAAIVFALTPLPWARYYLPVLPFTLMMAAYALTRMSGAMRKRRDMARR
ncbi:MAG: glycosyltransferase family 39 protein [Chloroflexota bacterium]|nr:glycosyltransferase family 39 protein [Chloroflexota bacterium]